MASSRRAQCLGGRRRAVHPTRRCSELLDVGGKQHFAVVVVVVVVVVVASTPIL